MIMKNQITSFHSVVNKLSVSLGRFYGTPKVKDLNGKLQFVIVLQKLKLKNCI